MIYSKDYIYECAKKVKLHNNNWLTNMTLYEFEDDDILTVENNDNCCIYIIKDRFQNRGFFISKDIENLNALIMKIDIPFYLYYNHKNRDDSTLETIRLNHYARYMRTTIVYNDINPYEIDNGDRKTKLLSKMYDVDCGYYATVDDADELYELLLKKFDQNSDELPTKEELKEICDNKECLIHRENNPVENHPIVAAYIWKLEGKKLYSRLSLNRVGANILYSMERRIFTKFFDEGIRVYYGWADLANTAALGRRPGEKEVIKTIKNIYCDIYTTEKKTKH